MLIDAHAHIALLNNSDLQAARNSDIIYLATGGTVKENRRITQLKSKKFLPVLGVAPLENCDIQKEIHFIEKNKPYAIGEIGLDYYWEKEEKKREKQKTKFILMLNLAKRLNLPAVIHSRDAESDVLDILNSFELRVFLHCFSGSLEELERAKRKGYMLSATPHLNAKRKQIIKSTPPSMLLVESDAPAMGGPLDSEKSAELISRIKGMPVESVIKQANENACNFFGLGDLFVF